ncbi:MAG TPA: SDR family oxidoreductase [Ktedonobacterales bacterium]
MESIFHDGLFAGQTIVVSGGGTGIGRAVAGELARLGATVVLCSRGMQHLEPARDAILAAGGQAEALTCNVRDPESVEAFFREAVARHGRIDGLVNNAGGQFISHAEAISPKGWHAVVETNLTGAFLMARAAFNSGMGQHGGSIVNIVMEMWQGFPGMAHSGAARAAVVNLTRTLAREWGQFGVRVNAVAPGLIDTEGMRNYGPETLAHLHAVAHEIPAGRMGTTHEIAAPIVFLLSPGAAFVSGATLRVDGGGETPYRFREGATREPWPQYTALAGDGGGDEGSAE